MDLRKTALAAAVLLGLDRALFIFGQARVFDAVPRVPWYYVAGFLVNVLLLVPLPVLLALLYSTGVAPIAGVRPTHSIVLVEELL